MSSLYYINQRIENVEVQLLSTYDKMYERSEQLGRMREAKEKFLEVRTDLILERSRCREPEFTPSTFYGSQATKINQLRENDVEESYFDITNEQMLEVLSQMDDTIERLSEEIRELNNQIVSLKNDRDLLFKQRE